MCLFLPHCVSVTLRQQLGGASLLGSESIFPDIKGRRQCLTAAGGEQGSKDDTIQTYLRRATTWPEFSDLCFEWVSLHFQTLFRLRIVSACVYSPLCSADVSTFCLFPVFCLVSFFFLISRMLVPHISLSVSLSAGWDQTVRNIYFSVTNNNGFQTFFLIVDLLLQCQVSRSS